jgi:hypothetical protein
LLFDHAVVVFKSIAKTPKATAPSRNRVIAPGRFPFYFVGTTRSRNKHTTNERNPYLTRIIQLIDPAVAQTGVLADWIALSPLPGHASSSPAAGQRADWRGFAG